MNYLDYPVLRWETNWREPVRLGPAYDARPEQIGFGAEAIDSLADEVQHTHEITLSLRGEDWPQLQDWIDRRRGPAIAFWLPGNERTMDVIAADDSTHFVIRAAGWADWWGAHPGSRHILLVDADGDWHFAEIIGVVADATGEHIELSAETAVAVDPEWEIRSLYLVRLAEDAIEPEFAAPGYVDLRLRVIELPLEIETRVGWSRPVWLYEFRIAPPSGSVTWRFTSHQQDVVYDGHNYSAVSIEHAEIKSSARGDEESIEILSWWEQSNPLLAFFPVPLACPMDCSITETSVGNLATGRVLFAGRVGKVSAEGKRITATIRSRIDVLGRVFPRFAMQPMCNYRLGSPSCGIDVEAFKVTGDIELDSEDNARRITVAACAGEQGLYSHGWLITGSGTSTEIRSILQSSEDGELTLNAPLYLAEAGQSVTVYQGCDGRSSTCVETFDNYERYGGHPFIPLDNLVLRAINIEAGENAKK